MADDIIQRIVVTAVDQASAVVNTVSKSFEQATQSISALGGTATEALNAAAQAAQRFGASAQQLQTVEQRINSLATAATNSNASFTELATAYDKARGVAAASAPAIAQVGQATAQVGQAAGQAAPKFSQAATMIEGMGAAAKQNAPHWSNLVAGMSAAGQAAGQVGQTAAQVGQATARIGQGAQTATGHVTSLHRQMGVLLGVLSLMGGGPMAGVVGAIGSVAITFGTAAAAAAGFAAALALLAKNSIDTAKAAEGLTRLSDVSGVAFSNISEIQNAFRLAGVGTEQFSSQFTKLVADYLNGSQQLERANLAVQESYLQLQQVQQQGIQIAQQLEDLQLQAAQRSQQAKQLALQTEQTQLQEQSIRTQLSLLPQINALETRRADLAVRTAEGQLAMMNLEDQLRAGAISDVEFEQRKAQLQEEERKRQKEALELQIREARQRKQQLAEEQQQRRQQLESQQKQLKLQEDGIKLQQQQADQAENSAKNQEKQLELQQQANKLAEDKAKLDIPAAERAAKLAANVDKAAEAILRGKEGMADLADLFKSLSAAEAFELGKKLGFDDKTIELLRRGGDAFRELQQTIRNTGLALSQLDQTNLQNLSREWEKFKGLVSAGFEKIGAIFAPGVVETLRDVNQAIIDIFKNLKEGKGLDLSPLVQALDKAGADIIKAAQELGVKIGEALVEAIKNALTPKGGFSFEGLFDAIKRDFQKFWDSLTSSDDALRRIQEQQKKQRQSSLGLITPAEAAGGEGAGAEQLQHIEHAAVNAKAKVDELGTALSNLAQISLEGMVTAFNSLAEAAQKIAEAFSGDKITGAFSGIGDKAAEAFNAMVDAAKTAASDIGSAFSDLDISSALSNQIDALIQKFNDLAAAARTAAAAAASAGSGGGGGGGGGGAPAGGGTGGGGAGPTAVPASIAALAASTAGGDAIIAPSLVRAAGGGLFRGRGGIDTNLAWLTDGEFIIRAAAVQRYGVGLLNLINSMQFTGFHMGGMVLPRAMPVPAFAAGGLNRGGGQRTLNLTIGGETFRGLSAPEHVAQQLERAAISRQTSSTGVKPRWNR